MELHSALHSASFSVTAQLSAEAAIAIAPTLAASLAAVPCALLIGNTRELWPRFVNAYNADAQLRASPDPFDKFVETTLAAVLDGRAVRFAHRLYDQTYVPMQRLAAASGLGALAPTQLVIHPTYGPWFSLRAIVAYQAAASAPSPGFAGCPASACQRNCQPAFDHAMAGATAGGPNSTWRDWLAVRTACTTGTAWRFSDEQIIYHYTKDRRVIGTGMSLADYTMYENTGSFER